MTLDAVGAAVARPKGSVEVLTHLAAADIAEVNAIIVARMQSPVAVIPLLADHLINAGGKRLRPLLTVASARLAGARDDACLKLAAAVEFIHTATLLHDDVVDSSQLRRGKVAAHLIWGAPSSVLVGDFLFAKAFELMVEAGSMKALDILAKAAGVIAEGEVLQLTTANDTETTESAYLEVIKAKTARLFAAAARVGAVVADRPKVEEDALESFGLNLGIAFQLTDDVIDYASTAEKMGKSVGDDFRDGKITLPVVLAFLRGDDEERAFWRRTLEQLDQRPGDLEHAIDLMGRHGSLRDTVERARHYGAIARDALGIFPEHPVKRALAELVEFAIHRAH
jgi:octaprenyl-diphosphate synthase